MSANSRRHQNGFGLLEILVAALVLSIGLLGMAALHLASIKSSQSAYYRAQATLLNYDIVDRMRANAKQARKGAYDVDLESSHRSGDALANTDMSDWQDALAAVLPSVQRAIACESDGDCTITVQWDDSRSELAFGTNGGGYGAAAADGAGPGEGKGNPGNERELPGGTPRKIAARTRRFVAVTRI